MNQSEQHFSSFLKSFRFDYRKRTSPLNMKSNHYHDAFEIYYLLSGERYYFIKDRTYHILKGDIVLINAYDLHKTTASVTPEHERVLINVKEDFFKFATDNFNDLDLFYCFKKNINILRLNIADQNFVESIFFRIMKECRDMQEGHEAYIKTLMTELLIFLNRYAKNVNPDSFEYPSNLHKKVSDIVVYINNNYMNDISLASISNQFYISTYYFTRIFKKVTGFSFVEYLNNVRIKEAQKLLRETKLNIQQVSEKVGFGSISHFGRIFKNITGLSPLKYRKINQ